jgi:hypothetical protein
MYEVDPFFVSSSLTACGRWRFSASASTVSLHQNAQVVL